MRQFSTKPLEAKYGVLKFETSLSLCTMRFFAFFVVKWHTAANYGNFTSYRGRSKMKHFLETVNVFLLGWVPNVLGSGTAIAKIGTSQI